MAWIKGTWYDDNIRGTSSDDRIEGFEGDDWIRGHAGNDRLFGDGGDDVLIGGSGHDDLYGGAGWDYLEGGTGNDHYFVDSRGDEVVEYAGEGIDAIHTILSSYSLPGNVEDLVYEGFGSFSGYGNSLGNYMYGYNGDDLLSGRGGADRLYGKDGDDDLIGGGGADRLYGGGGQDWLYGGRGNDVLYGGAGADDFHFDTALNASTNVDKIKDFTVGSDAIFLDRDIFTGIEQGGALAADAFVEGTRARDAEDRIVYDEATGRIFYDADGAGGAAAILFATVTAGTDLIASDFIAYG